MIVRKSVPQFTLSLLLALSVGCGGSEDAAEFASAQHADDTNDGSTSAADITAQSGDLNIQSGAIVIYEHCYYGGAYQIFYYPRDINSLYKSLGGNWNDRMSSVRIFGAAARIYEHDNWQGNSITVTSDIECIPWWGFNDVASSLEWL
jgi:hypothetical protein